jgi:hypothetical protein
MENSKDFGSENIVYIVDDAGKVMLAYEVKHRQEVYNG